MKKLLILLVLVCPGVWQVGMNLPLAVGEWLKLPSAIVSSTKAKMDDQYLVRVVELRWGGYKLQRNDILSKILYSKLLWIGNNIFDWLEFGAPRIYFLAGDGSRFSPANIEPIPAILFPFWLAGILIIIKYKKFRPLIILSICCGIGYLSGIKNMAILLPALITQVYISVIGLNLFKDKKWFKLLVGIIVIYCIYSVDMTLYAR